MEVIFGILSSVMITYLVKRVDLLDEKLDRIEIKMTKWEILLGRRINDRKISDRKITDD